VATLPPPREEPDRDEATAAPITAAPITAEQDRGGAGVAPVQANWAPWRVRPAQGAPGAPWECQSCPRCGTTGALLVEPAGTRFFCAHCAFEGDASVSPERFITRMALTDIRWPAAQLAWTVADVLDADGLAAAAPFATELFRAQAYFDDHGLPGWREAVFAPVREEIDGPVVDYVQISLDDDGRMGHSRRVKGARALPWGWEQITGEAVLVVEQPADRLALLVAGQSHAVCLPPSLNPAHASGGDWTPLALIEQRLKTIHRVDLAIQNDEAGHRLEDEISRRFGRDRCYRTRWQSHAVAEGEIGSAASVYRQYGSEGVGEALAALSPYPVAGIHQLIDVDEEYESYYDFGFQPGASVGLPSMDDHYRVPEGQVTLILGVPGHGKSTLADEIIVRLAKRYGWKTGVFTPENQPIARYYASLTEKYVGKPFNDLGPDYPRMTVQEKNEGKRWVNAHFPLILPDDEHGNWSLDSVLELAKTLVFRHGIQGLVIDPWNELDHARPAHMTHDDYLAQQLGKLKRFARTRGLHVWVIAHPTKLEHKLDNRYPVPTPYTSSGGAMWFNKADFILVPYRHRGDDDEEITDIYGQKVRQREHGKIGVFSLRYDVVRNGYVDDVDMAIRAVSNGMKRPMNTLDQCLPLPRPDSPVIMHRARQDLLRRGA